MKIRDKRHLMCVTADESQQNSQLYLPFLHRLIQKFCSFLYLEIEKKKPCEYAEGTVCAKVLTVGSSEALQNETWLSGDYTDVPLKKLQNTPGRQGVPRMAQVLLWSCSVACSLFTVPFNYTTIIPEPSKSKHHRACEGITVTAGTAPRW